MGAPSTRTRREGTRQLDILIDTGIIVDALRQYEPALDWLQKNRELIVGISPIVWMELIRGAENKALQNRAEKLLQRFEVVYPTPESMQWAMLQLKTYRLSDGIGMNDCLIAAPSHCLQVPLYTRNLKHFAPVLGELARQPY